MPATRYKGKGDRHKYWYKVHEIWDPLSLNYIPEKSSIFPVLLRLQYKTSPQLAIKVGVINVVWGEQCLLMLIRGVGRWGQNALLKSSSVLPPIPSVTQILFVKLTRDPVQEGAERHNSLFLPSSSARVCPKSFARAASPREYPSFYRDSLVPHTRNTIAFCICIYILPTFPPNKIKALGPGYARQFTWSTENKTLSLSPSFLLASLLLNTGDFPWSQNNYVSGSGLPVYSLPHWSGTRGEERR